MSLPAHQVPVRAQAFTNSPTAEQAGEPPGARCREAEARAGAPVNVLRLATNRPRQAALLAQLIREKLRQLAAWRALNARAMRQILGLEAGEPENLAGVAQHLREISEEIRTLRDIAWDIFGHAFPEEKAV